MDHDLLSRRLVGTWLLESFSLVSDAGTQIFPMGRAASGYVSYSDDGWMSFQVSASGRQPYDVPMQDGGSTEQTVAAARSFLAYAGPYTVDEVQSTVSQQVEQCLVPNWVGDLHVRHVTLDGAGGLVLASDPFPIGPTPHRVVLRFQARPATR
ncbi:hypothetical protein CLD22_23770 [Rubrivivax gelatinosus]|nr:hypothetical protein [Rubrivivax gelatinosus]